MTSVCVPVHMCKTSLFSPLFLYEKFILNHPSLISSLRSHSFSVCTDCLLYLTWCTNICYESSRECVCVIYFPTVSWPQRQSTACKKTPHKMFSRIKNSQWLARSYSIYSWVTSKCHNSVTTRSWACSHASCTFILKPQSDKKKNHVLNKIEEDVVLIPSCSSDTGQ